MSAVAGLLGDIKRTLRRPMAEDATLLAGSLYASTGLSLITTVVVARLLGPADYGLVALAMSWPTLMGTFVVLKSEPVTTRYVSIFRATAQNEKLKSMCKLGYGLDFLISIAALVLVSLTSPWVARHVFGKPELAWLMVAYAASFPFWSLAGTSWALFSCWRRFRWLAVFQILDRGMASLIVIGLVVAGFGVPGVVLGTALGNSIIGLTKMAVATYALNRDGVGLWWKASLSNVRPLGKEIAPLLGWNSLTVTLGGLMGQVPVILLGHLRGPEEAGFYRLATNFVAAGSYLEAALGRVVYPLLSARWGAGEGEKLNRTLKDWTLRGGLPIGAVVLFTVPLLPIVVPAVFGPSYSPTILGAQVMLAGAAVSAVFFWLVSFYYASGKISLWSKAYGLQAAFVIGLAWPCIRWLGFSGLAILIAMAKVIFTLCMAAILRRHRFSTT